MIPSLILIVGQLFFIEAVGFDVQFALNSAETSLKGTLGKIVQDWRIHEFPIFLKAPWAVDDSYELFQHKFAVKIVSALLSQDEKLVIT
jgi:hypothetical protein